MAKISDPLVLPCGATLPNRLAKAAMTEGLATPDGCPTPQLCRLYGLWSDGGAGLLLSGNVQLDRDHLERPGNVVLQNGHSEDDSAVQAMKEWTKSATRNGNHFWVQLSHAGRQVQKDVNPTPKAPSAVKVGLPGGKFGEPVPLTISEIQEIISSFATAAKTCQEAGFTGVQIHAAHGYLLSSFLNPRVNQRTDKYGGSLENRARILLDVVKNVRDTVGPKFPVSVKLNSADFQKGGFRFEDSLQVVQWLEKATVDLIEISGGNYEQGAFMNIQGMEEREEQNINVAPSTKAREAYFLDFAKAMQDVVTIPLMVTGGFRSKVAMDYALESGAADLIGIGRPMCVMTDAPKQLLDGKLDVLPRYEEGRDLIPEYLAFLKRFQIFKTINAFGAVYWFYEQLESLGQTGKPLQSVGNFQALLAVEARNNRILAARTKGVTVRKEASSMLITPGRLAMIGVATAVGAGYLIQSSRH